MHSLTSPPLPWEAPFFDALRRGMTASAAADAAGVARSTPYSRRNSNARFDSEWQTITPKTCRKPAAPGARSPQWRRTFLEALAETSNVTAAAAAAKLPPSSAYKTRRDEPDFRAQWHQALREGYEHLEMETLHRLRMGTSKDDPKFDIANALRLLALHRGTVTREGPQADEEDEGALYAALDAKIDAMRAREREASKLLTAEGHNDAHDLT